ENNNIEITLQNLRSSSEKLKTTVNDLGPTGRNIADFSETIKTQPWRLIWPSTKKSPEKSPTPSEATITVRKSAKPRATATPGGRGRYPRLGLFRGEPRLQKFQDGFLARAKIDVFPIQRVLGHLFQALD